MVVLDIMLSLNPKYSVHHTCFQPKGSERKALINPIFMFYTYFAYTTSGKSDTFGYLSIANTEFMQCKRCLGKIFAKSGGLSGVSRSTKRSGGGKGFDQMQLSANSLR